MELALAAPILIFALIGGLDLMRVAAINQAVQNSARVGAELATSNTAICDDVTFPPTDQCKDATITLWSTIFNELSATPGVPSMNPSVRTICGASPPDPGASPCMVPPPRNLDNRYTGTPANCSGSVSGAICFLRVRVQYTFRTIVPWPGMPNTITVDKSAFMPMIR